MIGLKVSASIRWKFMIIMTAILLVGTAGGTLSIVANQKKTLRMALLEEGKSLATFAAKMSWEPIITNDSTPLDAIVSDLNLLPEVAYAVIQDAGKAYLTSPSLSMNRTTPGAEAVLASLPEGAGLEQMIKAYKERLQISELVFPIMMGERNLGDVILGMSEHTLSAQIYRTTLFVVLINLAVTVLLAASIYLGVQRIIVHPLGKVASVSSKVAEGDLRHTVPVDSADEVGKMAASVNEMIDSLRGMIHRSSEAFGSVNEIANDLTGVSAQVSGITQSQKDSIAKASRAVEEMNNLLQEVGKSVNSLFASAENASSGTTEMAASVDMVAANAESLAALSEDVSSAITEMSATVQQVNRNVADLLPRVEESSSATARIERSIMEIEKSAASAMELTRKVAASISEEAGGSLRRTVESFTNIQNMVKDATKTMDALSNRSQAIGNVVGIINEISEQTSLLALNASILAAQAGEGGRGFAVVAQEIRELAGRAANSTKEIDQQIRGVQQESKKAVAALEASASVVDRGVNLIGDLSAVLERVNKSSVQASEASAVIAAATSEQVKETAQISAEMDHVTKMAKEITKATSEQAMTTGQIVQIVTKMRDQAEQVKRSTVEQSRGTKDIAGASRSAREMAQGILQATREEAVRSRAIVESIDEVQEVCRQSVTVVGRLDIMIGTLSSQSLRLKEEIGKFSV